MPVLVDEDALELPKVNGGCEEVEDASDGVEPDKPKVNADLGGAGGTVDSVDEDAKEKLGDLVVLAPSVSVVSVVLDEEAVESGLNPAKLDGGLGMKADVEGAEDCVAFVDWLVCTAPELEKGALDFKSAPLPRTTFSFSS